jgi:hypothetical protein
MENQETVQDASQVTPEAAPPQQPDLTITDLTNIRAIIDVAVRRGAFGASEASGVGTVFDKLNAFLNAVAPPKSDDKAPKQ